MTVCDVHPRRAQRWRDAEEDRARQRDYEREREHEGIERRLLESRHSGGRRCHECTDAPGGEPEAHDRRDERQDDAFGEELAGDAGAAGTERDADGQLAGASGASRQQQVGDVAAGDEQHQADRAQQDEQTLRVVADQVLEGRSDREVELQGIAREGDAQAKRVGAQLAERLFDGGIGFQPAGDQQIVLVVHRLPLGSECNRYPQLHAVGCVVELRRHHADDIVGTLVQRDLPADNRRVGPKAARPQPMAEHDDLFAARLILFPGEDATERRRQVEDLEEAGSHTSADNPFGVAAIGKIEARILLRGDGAERGDRFDPVGVVAGRAGVTTAARAS